MTEHLPRKGEAIDALNRLKVNLYKSNQNIKDWNTLDTIIREDLEGCEWSHDRMLSPEGYFGHRLTPEQHATNCGCDCDFCFEATDQFKGRKP